MKHLIQGVYPITEEEKELLKKLYEKNEVELENLARKVAQELRNRFVFLKERFSSLEALKELLFHNLKALFLQEEKFFFLLGIKHYYVISNEERFKVFIDVLLILVYELNTFLSQKISPEEAITVGKVLTNFIAQSIESFVVLRFIEYKRLLFAHRYLYEFLSAVIKELNEALRFQQIFLANVSHEIRTPLNAILGYLRLLENDEGLSEENRKLVRYAIESSDVLLRLINDILDASKLHAGEMEILSQPVDILEIVSRAVQLFKHPRKSVRFRWSLDYYPYYLLGDRERIKQIIVNLLSNAFKFTKKGLVELTMRVTEKGEQAEVFITVKDTGIGIPEEKKKHIFQPFKQAEISTSGTGLGLYISREIARKMGGDIWFESKVGEGTTFYVRLVLPRGERIQTYDRIKGKNFAIYATDCPCLKVLKKFILENQGSCKICHGISCFKEAIKTEPLDYVVVFFSSIKSEEGAELLSVIKEIKEGIKILVHDLWWKEVPEDVREAFDRKAEVPFNWEEFVDIITQEEEEEEEVRKDLRVLVIDDLKTNCEVAKLTIEKFFKAKVDTALSAQEGLELVKKNFYDVIFLDIKMPEIDGFQAVKMMREMGVKSPIIALSADAFKTTIEKALTSGFDDYLTKPFTKEGLRTVLEKYAGNKEEK